MWPAFTFCYITDRHALKPKLLLPLVSEAARAGVDLIQIREKDLPVRELASLTHASMEAARGMNCRIVVNDRLDVALAQGAAGVHLGTQSVPPDTVRRCVPGNFLVGVSCHSVDDVLHAAGAGADYVLLGPIFPTPSKLRYGPPLGLEVLHEAAGRVKIPVLALGGIDLERVKPCAEAGAKGVAGISIFQNCDSLAARVRELREAFSLRTSAGSANHR